MSQAELAQLPDAASMADVLERVAGPWGAVLIRLGLLVSVAGAFLSWTLFAAEIPSVAAGEGMMPKLFGKANAKGSPRSEEHTSELPSLMRISYAVFCLKK